MRKIIVINISLACLFLFLFHFRLSFVEAIRLRVEDGLYLFQHLMGREHRPHPDLLVVAVDEKSINQLGRWPWDRRLIARMVESMSQAELVAFDVVFSEPSEGDGELAQAIEEAGNVVLGFFFRRDATQWTTQEEVDELRNSELLRVKKLSNRLGVVEFPYAEVNVKEIGSSALMQAPFNSEPDPDGLYRRYPLLYLFNGSFFPSMALQVYRLYKNQDLELAVSERGVEKARIGREELPLSSKGYLLLNFPKGSEVRVISAVDLLSKSPDLRGKIVFFGATEIGIYDIRPTPLDPSTPGVFLHYTALSNLLKGELIKDLSWTAYLSIPLLSISVFFLVPVKRLKGRALLFSLTASTFLLSSLTAFAYGRVYIPFFYPLISFLLSYLSLEAFLYYTSEKRVGELRRAFSSYVSPQLLELILKEPERLRLGGEKREITVLFSDLRGFTSLSEGLEPEALVGILNEYLEPMTQIVLEEGGMLDKYIGDAIMAVFNAPIDLPEHQKRACRTALRMIQKLRELNEGFRERYGLVLDIGVGINTGSAVVGNMGSQLRFDYTAIGDTVNLASRLEGLNKLYHTHIIVSEYTAQALEDEFLLRPLDRVAVKGKKKPVLLYELMEDTPQNREVTEKYSEALEAYFSGNFQEGLLIFEELIILYNDGASKTMAERCRKLLEEPPERWEGVYVAKEK